MGLELLELLFNLVDFGMQLGFFLLVGILIISLFEF
jgi:hypothetical protein